MAESVYALDLKSSGEIRGGSSPSPRTKQAERKRTMLNKEDKQKLDKMAWELFEKTSQAHERSLLRWTVIPFWKSITITFILAEIILVYCRIWLLVGLIIPVGVVAGIIWLKARGRVWDIDQIS